jgi:hypothetical protein
VDSLKPQPVSDGFMSFKAGGIDIEDAENIEFTGTNSAEFIQAIVKLAFARFPGHEIKVLIIETLLAHQMNADDLID